METQEKLIAAIRNALPTATDAEIARRLKLSPPRWNNYTQGIRHMNDDALIAACDLLGWDTQKILAQHHSETAKTPRERAFWQRWAAVIATAILGPLAITLPIDAAKATAIDLLNLADVRSVHYAQLRRMARFMLARLSALIRGESWTHHHATSAANDRTLAPLHSLIS